MIVLMALSETVIADGDDDAESKEPVASMARRSLREHVDELLLLQISSSGETSKRRARWPEGFLEDALKKKNEYDSLLSKSESSMEESSRRAAATRLPLPPRLPLDADEPWWVLPSARGGGDGAFAVLGGAPAAATPLAAMLRRIASSSSGSAFAPLSHADTALAIRLLETEPEASVSACQSLLESRRGEEAALTRVARASPCSPRPLRLRRQQQQQQQQQQKQRGRSLSRRTSRSSRLLL